MAERTKLGWFIMSPGAEFNKGTMLLTQTSQADFETLCRLDVLGLADIPENDQDAVYQDFKEQLVRKGGMKQIFPGSFPSRSTDKLEGKSMKIKQPRETTRT